MNNEFFETKLISKKNIATNTLELVFEKPGSFSFEPGQFVQFQIPDENNSVLRSYSIASSPTNNNITVYVKLLENGKASSYFKKIEPGDKLTFGEALGKFVYHPGKEKYYYIATGVGLAPILSMIKTQLEEKKTTEKIKLLFGVRNEEFLFCLDQLNSWQKNHKNFNFEITLSQASKSWSGLKGRVVEHLPQEVKNTQFYLCGSVEMVKEVRQILIDKGVDSKDILFEMF